MKITYLILLFISFQFGYSQDYSNRKIENQILKLTEMVIDTSYFDEKFEKLELPKLEYWVNDNITGWIFSHDPNYFDNEMFSIFQKIFKKGKENNFIKMSESENPSIRIYGFWALVKNEKYLLAESIIENEKKKKKKAEVYWNSAGCLDDPILTVELMSKLIERMKKYGS